MPGKTAALALTVLAVGATAVAGVDVLLVDGRTIAADAVERRGEVYVLDLPDGGSLTLPVPVVGGLRFSVGDVAPPSPNGPRVQIALTDGRILEGIALERRDGLYLLTRSGDSKVSVPEDLVLAVRLSEPSTAPAPRDGPPRNEPRPPSPPARGIDGPASSRISPPAPDLPPSRAEQLGVFGDASVFPVPRIPSWRPRESFASEGAATGRASTWARAAHGPSWKPRSSFEPAPGLPDFDAARWYRPVHDPRWRPSDGWIRASRLVP